MFRYLGFVWDADDVAASETAGSYLQRLQAGGDDWQLAFRSSGVEIFCAGLSASNRSYHLHDSAGIVLGKLFARSAGGQSVAAPLALGAQETASILATGGQHLLQSYWGRYVAVLHEVESRTTRILRDPTGGFPCLSMSAGGVEIYCSRLEDAAGLGLHFSIDWEYVAAHLCCQRLELSITGVKEVTQVLGGECVSHQRRNRARTFLWDPLRIADENSIDDTQQAVDTLRRATIDSVRAWATSYDSIVHTLSGGLDSAIVLASLKDAPARPQITCVNYHSPGAAGDERVFARLAARRMGFELLERERRADVSFEPLLHMPRSIAPTIYRYYLENSRAELDLARERGATALFSGEGGDQLFYQSRAAFGAGDYLHRRGRMRGLGSEFSRVALDAARVDQVSVWHVLRGAIQQAYLGRRWNALDEVGQFSKLMSADVIAAIRGDERWLHPHFRRRSRVPSGKLWHAYSLVFPALEYYDPLGILDGVERVAPLFSQPVLEACLRIPVDVLTTGGWDRAIARRAFRDELPREISTRRGKGDPGTYVNNVLAQGLGFVREMLLDGELVRQNIIDRARLEAVLSGNPTRVASGSVEVYDCLNVEAWVQRFKAGEPASNQDLQRSPDLANRSHRDPQGRLIPLQDPTAS